MTSITENAKTMLSRRALLGAAAATALLPVVTSGSARADGPARSQPLPRGLRPEGITSGPGDRFYVGSLANGRIVTGHLGDAASGTEVLWPGASGRSLRGLYWDRRTGLVWAVGNRGDAAYVWAIDASSGSVMHRFAVPGGVFLNDLVVTRRAVYVTDSYVDRITVIALRADGHPSVSRPSFVTLGGLWPGPDGVFKANGVRALPDGSLVMNHDRVGGLWRVHPTTGAATRIPVDGPRPQAGDGLVIDGTLLYNVRSRDDYSVDVLRLSRAATDSGWRARFVTSLTDPGLDVPSTATISGQHLWAVNARFGIASPEDARYSITRLPLR